MNFQEINKAFSQALKTKLSDPDLVVFTEQMGGSQGEIAKVLFKNIKTGKYYALWLDRVHSKICRSAANLTEDCFERVELIWSEAEEGYRPENTFWLNHTKVLWKNTFFQINYRGFRNGSWYGTFEEAVSAIEVHRSRWNNRNVLAGSDRKYELENPKAREIALRKVKNERGWKSGKTEIEEVVLFQEICNGEVKKYYVRVTATNKNNGREKKDIFFYTISDNRH